MPTPSTTRRAPTLETFATRRALVARNLAPDTLLHSTSCGSAVLRSGAHVVKCLPHLGDVAARSRHAALTARLLSMPAAPGLSGLLDHFGDDRFTYHVFRWHAGGDLYASLEENGRGFSEARALEAIRGVLKAIEVLHGAGLVHRDVKLENVVLEEKGRGEVVVIDFDLLEDVSVGEGELIAAEQVGTVLYFSPELDEGALHDVRKTDMWAVGVVFYAMLAYAMPFGSDGKGETVDWGKVKGVSPGSRFVLTGLLVAEEHRLTAREALSLVDALLDAGARGWRKGAAIRLGGSFKVMRNVVPSVRSFTSSSAGGMGVGGSGSVAGLMSPPSSPRFVEVASRDSVARGEETGGSVLADEAVAANSAAHQGWATAEIEAEGDARLRASRDNVTGGTRTGGGIVSSGSMRGIVRALSRTVKHGRRRIDRGRERGRNREKKREITVGYVEGGGRETELSGHGTDVGGGEIVAAGAGMPDGPGTFVDDGVDPSELGPEISTDCGRNEGTGTFAARRSLEGAAVEIVDVRAGEERAESRMQVPPLMEVSEPCSAELPLVSPLTLPVDLSVVSPVVLPVAATAAATVLDALEEQEEGEVELVVIADDAEDRDDSADGVGGDGDAGDDGEDSESQFSQASLSDDMSSSDNDSRRLLGVPAILSETPSMAHDIDEEGSFGDFLSGSEGSVVSDVLTGDQLEFALEARQVDVVDGATSCPVAEVYSEAEAEADGVMSEAEFEAVARAETEAVDREAREAREAIAFAQAYAQAQAQARVEAEKQLAAIALAQAQIHVQSKALAEAQANVQAQLALVDAQALAPPERPKVAPAPVAVKTANVAAPIAPSIVEVRAKGQVNHHARGRGCGQGESLVRTRPKVEFEGFERKSDFSEHCRAEDARATAVERYESAPPAASKAGLLNVDTEDELTDEEEELEEEDFGSSLLLPGVYGTECEREDDTAQGTQWGSHGLDPRLSVRDERLPDEPVLDSPRTSNAVPRPSSDNSLARSWNSTAANTQSDSAPSLTPSSRIKPDDAYAFPAADLRNSNSGIFASFSKSSSRQSTVPPTVLAADAVSESVPSKSFSSVRAFLKRVPSLKRIDGRVSLDWRGPIPPTSELSPSPHCIPDSVPASGGAKSEERPYSGMRCSGSAAGGISTSGTGSITDESVARDVYARAGNPNIPPVAPKDKAGSPVIEPSAKQKTVWGQNEPVSGRKIFEDSRREERGYFSPPVSGEVQRNQSSTNPGVLPHDHGVRMADQNASRSSRSMRSRSGSLGRRRLRSRISLERNFTRTKSTSSFQSDAYQAEDPGERFGDEGSGRSLHRFLGKTRSWAKKPRVHSH